MELTNSSRAGEAELKAMSIRLRSPLMGSSKSAIRIEKLTGQANTGQRECGNKLRHTYYYGLWK